MDPVTHVLLGASLGYATFGQRLGRTAAIAGGLAAFAPDADVFIRSVSDPLLAIEHHRGFTHSLTFAPAGAAIVAALWLLRSTWRSARWRDLWVCCLLGYLSHVLLDAATTYGTQLLWPWSRTRSGWDVISIIDPLFTVVLFVGLVAALARKKISAVALSLALAGLYVTAGAVQHARAVQAQRALAAARGHRIDRYEVMPTLANNVIWRALYVHDGRIFSDRLRVGWFTAPQVRSGWSLPVVDASELTPDERARNRRNSFERFAWFSEHWTARSPMDSTVIADMRYSLSAEAFDPIWGIRFTPATASTEVEWINRTRERKVEPGALWAEVIGRDARFTSLADATRPPLPASARR